jgi:PAS domain S-box-containing protein
VASSNSYATPERASGVIEHIRAESEERYRTLFELAPVAVYSCDASGIIRDYNSRAAELWGRRPQAGETDERFCGSFKMYRPDGSYMPHDQCPMGDVLTGKVSGIHDGEVHIERPDDSRIIVIVNIAPLKNERGEVVGAISCFYDVTERKKAREEFEKLFQERTTQLEQKTAELSQKATLLDLANDAVLVRNAKGKISYWNEGAERLYGWTSAEVLGRTTFDHLRTEFPVPLSDILRSDRWEGELHQYKKDGSPIVVASRWTTLRDNNGKPTEWLEINTDITERKRAEEAARKLSGRILTLQDEERHRIARGLHDSLGQYLTALKINLNLIPTNDGAAALVAECADIVEKCLSETRTISHLLHPPLLDEAGLKSALQWCVEGFAQRSGVKVNLNLPCELGRFHKDIETALFRVVQEALTNVHRHSHASEVNIRLTVDARYVGLIVDDNGRGIPDEKFNDLKLHGGTGVGLAGMRERVRDLGGSFGIESKTGTSLRVSIPIANTTREEAPKTRDHKESSLHSCGNLPS